MKKLEVKNLRRVYATKEDEFVAVDDFSFEVCEGEIVAIIGPNGAGKTTTIKILANYLSPTSGEIYFDGNLLKGKEFSKLNIGVVFGGEQGFYNNVSAYENLKFFSKINKIKSSKIDAEIDQVLEYVSLLDNKNKKVGKFSRGMKQRLHIARALLGSPDVLLLDEPTTGLDIEIAHDIRNFIRKIKGDGKVIILTSHKMDEISQMADKVVVIGAGKSFFNGTPNKFIEHVNSIHNTSCTNLEEAYLQFCDVLKR